MNISILTVFEQLYDSFVQTSLIKRAQEKKIVHIDVQSLFTYVAPKERIDGPIFGPGSGMLIRPDVVERVVTDKESLNGKAFKIFFSPQGKKIDQNVLKTIAEKMQEYGHLMILPARYEGMDARVEEEYADMILSCGDFVLMGGDIPAMMLLEGVLRLFDNVVGKQESVEKDSFTGPFVDFPSYTEPVEWKGRRVPDIIRSGNHGAIDKWRKEQSIRKTVLDHFAWLRGSHLTSADKKDAFAQMPHHYVALMHSDVLVGESKIDGFTSVTSIDIHDIARSSKTYGIKQFFIVTPLVDQQKIVSKMLSFWKEGIGFDYNQCRYNAIQIVSLQDSLKKVIEHITAVEGKEPLIIVTSARPTESSNEICFFDQSAVWKHERPVLILFGTGQGLAPSVIDRADFVLLPISGLTEFNHLSVRSAVAIALDRWLGVQQRTVKKLPK
jgi:tRNA (guanine37-N1)-methyltransferase